MNIANRRLMGLASLIASVASPAGAGRCKRDLVYGTKHMHMMFSTSTLVFLYASQDQPSFDRRSTEAPPVTCTDPREDDCDRKPWPQSEVLQIARCEGAGHCEGFWCTAAIWSGETQVQCSIECVLGCGSAAPRDVNCTSLCCKRTSLGVNSVYPTKFLRLASQQPQDEGNLSRPPLCGITA